MERLTERKIVLIVRETRLEELKARFNTVSQARFYVEQLGGDFSDYENEDAAYRKAVTDAQQSIAQFGRLQMVARSFLPNFIFGPDDLIVAVGQDGLVANTLKYLDGQLLLGVNPDPRRYDGKLLPFSVGDLKTVLPEALSDERPVKAVTMAKATLNNGQTLHAVNDLFIGPASHGSARYTLRHEKRSERQSSSGVIVSTGTPGNFQTVSGSVNVDFAPSPRILWRVELRTFRSKDEIYPTRSGMKKNDGFAVLSAAVTL